jgi:hypothetical protein
MITTPQDIENLQNELAEARATIRRFEEHSQTVTSDNLSLGQLVKEKNSKIIALETENARLKMQRTDKENALLVDGLRKEVGARDRKLVELKRVIEKHVDNEKLILVRATIAEQRAATFQNTITLMQAGRDAADAKVDEVEKARLEAIRKMVDAVSAREGLNKKISSLLDVITATTKLVSVLPPGLLQSKDVRTLLALMKKMDVRLEEKPQAKVEANLQVKSETNFEVKS